MSREKIEKNCNECLHFEACCKWTDFPKQIGFPTCRKFAPILGYRKQSENTVGVIRCKDCAVIHNKWIGCTALHGLVTPPDFYCALAEPKMTESAENATDINVGNKSKWISVEERLPEDGGEVLIYGDKVGIYTACYDLDYGFYGFGDPDECSCIDNSDVTHWMPLPEPPKKGGGEK